jgi:hypothetical protein
MKQSATVLILLLFGILGCTSSQCWLGATADSSGFDFTIELDWGRAKSDNDCVLSILDGYGEDNFLLLWTSDHHGSNPLMWLLTEQEMLGISEALSATVALLPKAANDSSAGNPAITVTLRLRQKKPIEVYKYEAMDSWDDDLGKATTDLLERMTSSLPVPYKEDFVTSRFPGSRTTANTNLNLSVCEVHRVPMTATTVRVGYGDGPGPSRIESYAGYGEARSSTFPHTPEPAPFQYDAPVSSAELILYVCSECEKAQEEWEREAAIRHAGMKERIRQAHPVVVEKFKKLYPEIRDYRLVILAEGTEEWLVTVRNNEAEGAERTLYFRVNQKTHEFVRESDQRTSGESGK